MQGLRCVSMAPITLPAVSRQSGEMPIPALRSPLAVHLLQVLRMK